MERKQFIKECRAKGLTWTAIGKLVGLTRQRVHQIGTDYYKIKEKPKYNWEEFEAKINEYTPIGDGENIRKITGMASGSRDRVRELVRIRDNHMCQICKIEWIQGNRRFDVHHTDEEHEGRSAERGHIKWDRENMDKMITLCHRCHLNLDSVKKKMEIGERKSTWKLDRNVGNTLSPT
jgi:hypothetical protein